MSVCNRCWREILWIKTEEGKSVSVDPDAVLVIEGEGKEQFWDDQGHAVTGRQAKPEEEHKGLYAYFVPHWRTCPYANRRTIRQIEADIDAGGLAPAT